MKQKTDETPDEWVRHMLSRLPDAPPPGSSFDSVRVWNQLRPELQAKPARRRAGWWLAAACLAGLVIGWLVWPLPEGEPKTAATYRPNTDRLWVPPARPESMVDVSEAAPAIAETHPQKNGRNTALRQPVHRTYDVAPQPVEPIAQVPEPLTTPTTTSVVANVPQPRTANVAVKTPKRRFRVMHENELRAEDEAAPKIYRPDHFVRLGTGQQPDEQRSDNVPDHQPPTLIVPLRNHSNQ